MLSDQNKTILEQKFTRAIISKFISASERSLETPRVIRLLTALCSCQGTPIPSNQTDIVQILFNQVENRQKFINLLKRQRHGEIEICLDLKKGRYLQLAHVI